MGVRAVRAGPLSALVLLSATSALPSQDRPLDWQFEERLRIGPALDGPEAFFRAYPWTIATDTAGRIYVLDTGNYFVRVFDEEGRHLREFGGRGGGPGEFVRPKGLAVLDDGTVVVADVGKGSLVRFDSVGTPIEQDPADFPLAPIASLGNELLVAEGAPETYRLSRVVAGETTTIAETGEREMIAYPGCPMWVPGRPLFAPQVHWSTSGTSLAINSSPSYEIVILEDGEQRRMIRRDIPNIEISRRDALDTQTAQRGFRITWTDNRCEVSGDDVAAQDREGWVRGVIRRAVLPALPYLALLACGEPEAAAQDAEPLLTIGRQLEGLTGEIFTEVVDGRITPDGRHIVLLDAAPPHVRVFDRQGALVAALIQEGDGPMEATDPHAIAVTDSTFALAELGRITIASLQGDPIASILDLSFIPQSITRGCNGDWLVYGRGRDGDSITWLRALSMAGHVTLPRTLLADEHPGPGTLVRRARPVVARDGHVLVYHDAPDTPRILQFDCPDYELVKDSPAQSAQRVEAETQSGDGAVAISPATDARPLSSVFFADGAPLVVRSRWKDGLWQEIVDADDAIVREGPATYRILDVVDDLALLAVSEPVPHAVVVHVEAVLELAPIATDSGSNGKTP